MGHRENCIGKYRLGRTIGEGTFAKVKLAVDGRNGRQVAVKIINKQMVTQCNLKSQVQREIRTMKLLHHPNIVQIHEVIGTKTKIYMVMEYVPGGQVSDKLSYAGKFNENYARKLFQQLIDAVDYCHNRRVCHRDLKPENLLLDIRGNLKVSDFGLSASKKPGDMLSTACGSPCYVAPELLWNRGYDGSAADVWSCGVILFELLAGTLPFEDRNIMNLYKKILSGQYKCPAWFTESQKRLLTRILEPNPEKRITIPEIVDDPWFQINYKPACGFEDEKKHLGDVNTPFDASEDKMDAERMMPRSSNFINAFQLIAMSNDLDLSGLFEEEDENKQKTKLGSKNTIGDTLKKIEAAANDLSLSIQRQNNKIKIHPTRKFTRCSRSHSNLSAEVIEVAPAHCVVEICKSAGELSVYKDFCKSLSSLLTDKSSIASVVRNAANLSNESQETASSEEEVNSSKDPRGYSSS
ncbi:hypothetical protein SAY87_013778 [Trapa incisa]|uniref:non-specific serine/threonine protein kinase n=1 Tax=Trapa incisa TaxID=236973 RepID=A0AAN7KBS1_9MYRT|nr:hypothetical protein SAY87_013778 [Trapa incisa]